MEPESNQAPHSRLFVLTAQISPVAVLLRRGPSSWYHVIRWDMGRDRFEHGAWIRARLFESRCDLSPDGELLLACVHQESRAGSSYSSAWTAVSRAPWLHALALWPQGTTYGGGGRFTGPRAVTLNARFETAAHPDHPADGLRVAFAPVDEHRSSNEVDGADWSGRDPSRRLIFTRGGRLFRRGDDGRDHEVADFRRLEPDPVEAPPWARAALSDQGTTRTR